MKRIDVIEKLEAFSVSSERRKRGEKVLAQGFANYLRSIRIQQEAKFNHWLIEPTLAQLVVYAIGAMDASDAPWAIEFRQEYLLETNMMFQSPLRIGTGHAMVQATLISMIVDVFEKSLQSEELARAIGGTLNAEYDLIINRMYQFMQKIYIAGKLGERIKACQKQGMSGSFGDTQLYSWVSAGRVSLTFIRSFAGNQAKVNFSLSEDNPLGLGIYIGACDATLESVLAMINEVMSEWPSQNDSFRADQSVRPLMA